MEIRGLSSFGIKCALIIFLIALPSVVLGLHPVPCIRGLVGCDPYEWDDTSYEDAAAQTRESTDRFYDDLETYDADNRRSYYSRPGQTEDISSSAASPSFTWRRRLDGSLERVPLNPRTSLQRPGLTTFSARPFERTTSSSTSQISTVQSSMASQSSSASIVGGIPITTAKNSIKRNESLAAAILHSSARESVVQTGCVDIFTINPWHGEDDDVIGAKCFLAGVFDPLNQKDVPWWTSERRTSFQYWIFIFAGGFAILLILMLLSRSKRQSENLAS